MALKLSITADDHAKLDDGVKALYEKDGEGFKLAVEGLPTGGDDNKELKEALRKEREDRAAAKKRADDLEAEKEAAEKKRLEDAQEFQKLAENEAKAHEATKKELAEVRSTVEKKELRESADVIVNGLTRDTARADVLREQALKHLAHTPEGVKINGPDGEAWDTDKLTGFLGEKYPFLVDGRQSDGGGAPGGKGGGAAGKKFSEMTGGELKALRAENPTEYERLREAELGPRDAAA